jgi:hypothetical protein
MVSKLGGLIAFFAQYIWGDFYWYFNFLRETFKVLWNEP